MAKKEAHHRAKRRAKKFFDEKRLLEAKKIYTQVCKTDTTDSEAWFMLGCTNHYLGMLDEAEYCMRKVLHYLPNASQAHNNLANILKERGNLDEAVTHYNAALRLKPDDAQVYCNLAATLEIQGLLSEAANHYHNALRLVPNLALALHRLGNLYHRQGRYKEAERYLLDALEMNPNNREIYNDLGNAVCDFGKHDQAIKYYREALRIRPDAITHTNLANILRQQGKLTEAIEQYEAAIQLNSNDAYAYNFLAATLKDQGRLDEAAAFFNTSLQLQPKVALARSNQLLFMNYQSPYDAQEVFNAHRGWGKIHERSHESPTTHANAPNTIRRLRIGYLSPDFCSHAAAYFIEPLLAHYDRESIEIYCYANVAVADMTTERLKRLVDHWHFIFHRSDTEVANQIRNDNIDILVDLAGHTRNNRLTLFALKPAPIQVTYLGYPNTTGMKSIDYRISDIIADPPGQNDQFYSETLIRLPHAFFCYQPPQNSPEPSRVPAFENGYITFASFNILAKINPQVITLWADILNSVPHSKLLIQSTAFSDQPSRERVQRLFEQHHISKEQLLLHEGSSFENYLALHNSVDIILDTFPWNGHTTTCHALWMGVPIVTLEGNRHASRMGTSILTNLELSELSGATPQDYRNIAVQLAGDLDRLKFLRTELRSRLLKSSLCNAKQFTHDIENAYKAMWLRQ